MVINGTKSSDKTDVLCKVQFQVLDERARYPEKKYFPLPEYDLRLDKVKVTIYGKVVDLNYALKVAEMPSLSLEDIIDLDKVAKKKNISDKEAQILKNKKLIEGRKPSYHISSNVATLIGEKQAI